MVVGSIFRQELERWERSIDYRAGFASTLC